MKTDQQDIIVNIDRVSQSFTSGNGKSVHVLDQVSFTVRQGEFVVLLGPTGCGKTTLINLIASLSQPDSGNLSLDPGLQRKTPCVFQHYTLFPWRTILKNVTFGLEAGKIPKKERREIAGTLIEKVGLKGFEMHYPHELSGGMRQRAAIAQALAIKPRLLLMDEPFGALDDITRVELQKQLVKIWQDTGVTVVFVTHNIDEALLLADKVIVLSKRPATILKQFEVDVDRPRRSSEPGLKQLFSEIRETLHCF